VKAKQEPAGADPWRALAGSADVEAVSLEDALRRLRVSEREAGSVKKGLLAEVTRLTEGPAAGPVRPK
jgi:hypothetical protein